MASSERDERGNADVRSPADEPTQGVRSTTRVPRLLVVEDREILRKGYAKLLHEAGYATSEAADLKEATYLIVQPHLVFDAAILDLVLTDGSGAELIQPLMRRRPLCRSMIVTGNEDAGPPVSLAQLGADTYVHKPVDPRSFLQGVKDTLEATAKWRRAARQGAGITLSDCSSEDTSDEQVLETPNSRLSFDIAQAMGRLKQLGDLTHSQVLTAGRLLWGDSDKEIADYLGCSVRTARHHVHSVLGRLGISNRASLLRVLLEDSGIFDPKRLAGAE